MLVDKIQAQDPVGSDNPLITLPCLGFFICKMGVALLHRMKGEDKCKAFSTY